MANSIGTPTYSEELGRGGYAPSLWTTVYVGSVTATFDTDVAADAGEEFSMTVTGAALGDYVVIIPQGADPEPDQFDYSAQVTAANTVNIAVHATAANTPLPTSFKFAVLRPNW